MKIKGVITILLILFLLVGGYFLLQELQKDQAPDDSSAANTETMLDWFDSELASGEYVAMHAERKTNGNWVSADIITKPFKTMVDYKRHLAFWRKDANEDAYYGEMFT